MFLVKIMLNGKFYTKINKKIMIWALRSEEREVTQLPIQKDFRKFVIWLRKKMGCN